MIQFDNLTKKQQKRVLALTHNIHKLTDFDLGLLMDICFDELDLRGKKYDYLKTRFENDCR